MNRELDGRVIEISRPDKVLFPDTGLTKGDLIDYYEQVAGTMLPHLRDRFVSMHRFPDGVEGEGFFQKDVPDYFPDWIRAEEVEKEGGTLRQLVIDDTATLVYLANQACITPHLWLSRTDRRRHPDRMIFDLDPPGEDWKAAFETVRWAARGLRAILDEIGLVPFVMTSGSRGLHVYVPLDRRADFDAVRGLARGVAELLTLRHPERVTTEQRRAKRGERIFIDVLRNAYAQTSVAPYAVRAREGAPVATPLDWDELGTSGIGPRRYTIENLFRRLGQRDDPWAGIEGEARGIEEAGRALATMRS